MNGTADEAEAGAWAMLRAASAAADAATKRRRLHGMILQCTRLGTPLTSVALADHTLVLFCDQP
jgi:hypothetical protein